MQAATPTPTLTNTVNQRAEDLLSQQQYRLWKQTDQLFAVLLSAQWLAAVAMAMWISPRIWDGLNSHIHPHLWEAIFLGGAIAAFPITLVFIRPGETLTRMVISTAQVCHSALLIHLSGGRIETHFHVFGSLAFLSFYRDWRVLIPATVVVALDHALRGMFWPESVFGVLAASPWRWLEHAGWVLFEDVFLIWACVRGAREMKELARRQAELEVANDRVEAEVARQTQRLESVSQELVSTARKAGMAEVATGVLHNVGNVLNSVNVSTSVVLQRLKNSEIPNLARATDMIRDNNDRLADFLTRDERGKHMAAYLIEASHCLGEEQKQLLCELDGITNGLSHLKQIVGAQQQHAKNGTLRERVSPVDLFEQAIAMDLGIPAARQIQIVRDFAEVGPTALDKHKVLQILINLLSNAKKAVAAHDGAAGQIVVSTSIQTIEGRAMLRFGVRDNGVGIAAVNLAKIFSRGFTTDREGHGFGLHSAAIAAREMDGNLSVTSDGVNQGANFSLDLPLSSLTAAEELIFERRRTEACKQM
jgi:signal transduction histidine kinase